jgi:hypothetical protein
MSNPVFKNRIVEAFKQAEAAGGMVQDQVAFMVGLLPEEMKDKYTNVGEALKECPQIAALATETTSRPRVLALLQVSQWREREDIVGTCADLIIRDDQAY